MSRREKSTTRGGQPPVKKPKVDVESSEGEMDEPDEIEVLYENLEESDGEKVKRLSGQLEAAIQREDKLRKELAQAKDSEETMKEERDKVKRLFEKCCKEARSFELRAEFAEGAVERMEAKCATDPELRKENISLHNKVGELTREKIELQKEVEEAKKKMEQREESCKKLTDEISSLRKDFARLLSSKQNEGKTEDRHREAHKAVDDRSEKKRSVSQGPRSGQRDAFSLSDYENLKEDVKRLRIKRNEWREIADSEKKRNSNLARDLEHANDDVKRMKKSKEMWMDKWDQLKKKSDELESTLKEAQCKRIKQEVIEQEKEAHVLGKKSAWCADSSCQTDAVQCANCKRLEERATMREVAHAVDRQENVQLNEKVKELASAMSELQKEKIEMERRAETSDGSCQTEKEEKPDCDKCLILEKSVKYRDGVIEEMRKGAHSDRDLMGMQSRFYQERIAFLEQMQVGASLGQFHAAPLHPYWQQLQQLQYSQQAAFSRSPLMQPMQPMQPAVPRGPPVQLQQQPPPTQSAMPQPFPGTVPPRRSNDSQSSSDPPSVDSKNQA